MGKTIRLLIIEDVEDDVLLLLREIRKGGFEPVFKRVDSEKDLVEALTGETWDIVISDYAMPGFTGIDALRIVKRHDPDIPFILHSGAIGEDVAVTAMKEGAGDYLMKDNLKRLIPAIERGLQDAETRKARKEAVKALEESENKYRLLVEDLNDVIYRTDQSGIINYISPVIQSLAGYDQSELIGRSFTKIIYKEDLDFLQKRFEELLFGVIKPSEYRLIKKSGEPVWVRNSDKLIYDGENVVGIRGVLTDISEEKKLQSQLQQSQKMEAIGTLAGGIAHDFNNILAIIAGYAEMAKESALPGTNQEEDLENVLEGAGRAKKLVQQILAFSRQSQVEPTQIKIQPLIKEGVKMLRSSVPTTISITEDIDPQIGPILAAPTHIHQILMNLGTNAYHAMEEAGGVLSVTLKSTFIGPDDKEKLLHVNSGEYVELTVGDTGTGIGPDVIEKIFDPYFTTKEIGKGTGMGLAIIYGIVKDSGGTITVESRIGKGTTFYVYFPIVEEGSLLEKEAKDIPKGTERILFVDDEQLLAKMGKAMLEGLGYHVTVQHSSIEALETFQNTPDAFDLVITDQTMHGMTGYDLARRMLQIKPDIPIILCTGYSNLVDEESVKSSGIKEFTLKPFTKEAIAKLIRKVLGEAV